jgi:hypothetical protein
MNESLLDHETLKGETLTGEILTDETPTDETLTTADIAHPVRAGLGPPAALDQRNMQTARETGETQNTLAPSKTAEANPLFPDVELHNFRARWDQVQTSFVDEPRQAVEQADSLVANVVKRIAEQFSTERANLENQWAQGDNVSTEDLRQALRRYRSFFDRLLTF